jgi:transcriptional regulator with XRE-family HTH domain
MIGAQQARGARAMLKWTVAELAQRAEVAPNTVVRFEAEKTVNTGTVATIQRTLEAAGIEFLPDNGVRLNTTEKSSAASPGGSGSGGSSKPQRQSVATEKPATRKAPRAKAAAMSKEAQIRALRERDS